MTSPQQLEILDLRHFNARQLRPLLEGEAAVWKTRLRWDYASSTELLLQYLDSRILPGFVALHRGRICGITFCVYEGQKAVIGDLYADPANPAPLAVIQTLARHLLETLQASPGVDRIEAQLLLYDAGVLPPAFASATLPGPAFRVYPRLFLETSLEPSLKINPDPGNKSAPLTVPTPAPPPAPAPPVGFERSRWSPAAYGPAADLIHAAYLGHIDADINDQYRTLAGSLRFLHNIVRFPGCGVFDPDSSWVLRSRTSNNPTELAAIILCSRVASDVAHVTQLCVAPAHAGLGLGRHLLAHCMKQLPTRGYRALTLTVTEANTAALNLYARTGFRTRHRFDALVLDNFTSHRLPTR